MWLLYFKFTSLFKNSFDTEVWFTSWEFTRALITISLMWLVSPAVGVGLSIQWFCSVPPWQSWCWARWSITAEGGLSLKDTIQGLKYTWKPRPRSHFEMYTTVCVLQILCVRIKRHLIFAPDYENINVAKYDEMKMGLLVKIWYITVEHFRKYIIRKCTVFLVCNRKYEPWIKICTT